MRAQQRRELTQHHIALVVAVHVVDGLEVVHVQQRHRQRLACRTRLLGRRRQGSRKCTPVGQASQWIGTGLFDQIRVQRIHLRVITGHLLLVPFALMQLLTQALAGQAQLQQIRGLARQRLQGVTLLIAQMRRALVEHAQRAQRHPFAGHQRCTRVEANRRSAGHHRVVVEAWVEQGVVHHQHFIRAQDRVRTERDVARCFAAWRAMRRLEPLAVFVHQHHGRHLRLAQRGRDHGEIVERALRRRIQHLVLA